MNIIISELIQSTIYNFMILVNIKIKKIEWSNSIDNKSIFKIINNSIIFGKQNDWKNVNGIESIIL